MKNDYLYSLKNLCFSYNEKMVLHIEKLDISPNKVTVFQGSNGCGKTTLLKLLNGLLIPSEGSILYKGIDIRDEKIRNKSVYLHQDPYLFNGTVEKNLNMVLKIKKIDKQLWQSRIIEILKQTGLENFEKRKCSELSGGEKKRVALARALLIKPEILLLDEPDANIDRNSSRLLEDIICKLKNEGISIIMSTHSREFAYRIGDVHIKIEEGRIKIDEQNIFRGIYKNPEGHYGKFQTGELLLAVPGLKGDYKTAVFSPNDVILSENKIETSAQNQIEGIVDSFCKKGSLYSVFLSTPEIIISHITEESFKSFKINTGKKLIIIFKASAIGLY